MNSTQSKFKADPYNPSNKLISIQDVIHIMKQVNMNDFKPNSRFNLLIYIDILKIYRFSLALYSLEC